jgi:hypothetical protein
MHPPVLDLRVAKIAQNRFQACGMVSVSTIAGTSALGKTREGKLEKVRPLR